MSVLRMTQAEADRLNLKNRAARKKGDTYALQNARGVARSTQAGPEGVSSKPDTNPAPKTRQQRPRYEQMLAEQCIVAGLPPFIMEYRFDLIRDWRIDLAWPPQLAVEIDGAVHRIRERFNADIIKHQALFFRGWKLLRVSTAQVRGGEAVRLIERALRA